MMAIAFNGEPAEAEEGIMLLAFLQGHGEPYDAALVERNGRLVRRELLATTPVLEGDRIEVVLPAFGG